MPTTLNAVADWEAVGAGFSLRRSTLTSIILVALLQTHQTNAAFVDVSALAGANLTHGYTDDGPALEADQPAAGVAAGDYDRDGWPDLYVTRGTLAPNSLLHNNHDGTFTDVAAGAGVAVQDHGTGPLFADVDGDGWVDLLVLGVQGAGVRLFHNNQDGTFAEVTASSGLDVVSRDSFSASMGDYDRDGDLDLFVTHWATFGRGGSTQQLWKNDGHGHFSDVSRTSQVMRVFVEDADDDYRDFSFTANFVDYDDDGWPDLLISADFGTTKLLHNEHDGTFRNATTTVLSDENGMGSAIGDYDNDGLVDWFVSSIWDPDGQAPPDGFWGASGNRLYHNVGGRFVDATDMAGVRRGYWGWGSSFADLDNDGWLDLVHVNGWGPRSSPAPHNFHDDPTRCFLNQHDGTLREASAELGLMDTRQGRGIVAFDYDRDGDIDLMIANHEEPTRLFRNDAAATSWLGIGLRGTAANTQGIGAKITVQANGIHQRRDVRAGNNFVSQDPAEAHVGLGTAARAAEVRVDWLEPDTQPTVWHDVPADEVVQIPHPDWLAHRCAGDCDGDGVTRIDDILKLVAMALDRQPPARCGALEAYPVAVDQIVRALHAALDVCVASPA